jgi:hypothetical protein
MVVVAGELKRDDQIRGPSGDVYTVLKAGGDRVFCRSSYPVLYDSRTMGTRTIWFDQTSLDRFEMVVIKNSSMDADRRKEVARARRSRRR